MPTYAVTLDHTGAIVAVEPTTQPLHEVPAVPPETEGETVQRLVHADNADQARQIVEAQLEGDLDAATAPPPILDPPPDEGV